MNNKITSRPLVMAGVRINATTTSSAASVAPDPSSGKYPTQIAIGATGAGAYIKVGSNFGASATNADLLIQPGDSLTLNVNMMQYVAAMAVSGTSTVSVASLSAGLWSNELAAPVAAMFASGMKGAWYERSNSATRYQENTGATPTTAAGQIVGLGLSRDQGAALGPEILTNGSFDAGATGWTVTGADATHIATFSGGALRYQSDTTTPNLVVAQPGVSAGKTYQVVVVVTAFSGGNCAVLAGNGFVTITGVGTYTRFLTNTAGANITVNRTAANVDLTIDSISVRELPGNHQSQATATARPLYQINPQRVVYDGVDDVLNTTFPATLGTNCTVGWAIPGTGAVISTAQNIGTAYADSVTACALVILDGPISTAQTASLTAYLNQQATL